MADGQHKLSRRALLGAPLVPLILSGAEPGRSPLSKDAAPIWARALARFRHAQTALDAAAHEPDQDAYDALLDAAAGALRALLALPAPDPAAVATKLDLVVAHQAWELTGSEDCLEILRQDARRLAAAAV